MMQLQLYELNYLDALYYVKENLINTNTLSSMLATRLDFKSGRFFTLLPQGIDIKKIYNFDHAGIAKGIRDKIADVIKHKLFLYSDISCIFDDASATFTPGYTDHLFSVFGLFYGSEIYYFLNKKTASIKSIKKCLIASNALWHSLCILSRISIHRRVEPVISSKDMEIICDNAQFVLIGAYDGEGYIFWEKQPLTTI